MAAQMFNALTEEYLIRSIYEISDTLESLELVILKGTVYHAQINENLSNIRDNLVKTLQIVSDLQESEISGRKNKKPLERARA